jgi:hypothetical protein
VDLAMPRYASVGPEGISLKRQRAAGDATSVSLKNGAQCQPEPGQHRDQKRRASMAVPATVSLNNGALEVM